MRNRSWALILWIAVNDRRLMSKDHLSGAFSNTVMGLSVLVTAGVLAALLAIPVSRQILKRRRSNPL